MHIAQLIPLPLAVSCSSKSRLVLPLYHRLTQVVPDRGHLTGIVVVIPVVTMSDCNSQ